MPDRRRPDMSAVPIPRCSRWWWSTFPLLCSPTSLPRTLVCLPRLGLLRHPVSCLTAGAPVAVAAVVGAVVAVVVLVVFALLQPIHGHAQDVPATPSKGLASLADCTSTGSSSVDHQDRAVHDRREQGRIRDGLERRGIDDEPVPLGLCALQARG